MLCLEHAPLRSKNLDKIKNFKSRTEKTYTEPSFVSDEADSADEADWDISFCCSVTGDESRACDVPRALDNETFSDT